jgi:methionyl-tRNA formyltransferase
MPVIGTFNLHASLLPQYRGAAPINWAIINGETETGATTFFLKHEIDTGEIILQKKEPIHKNDTAGSLYERLMHMGAELVLKTVKAIENDEVKPTAQVHSSDLKHAPKIFTETCEIDWNQPAENIYNFIRGLSPYPGAWMKWSSDHILKIYKASISDLNEKSLPGTKKSDNKNELMIKTSDLWLNIEEIQLQGKKRMSVQEFLRGNRVE